MQLAPDELLRAIRLPRRAKPWRQYYRKVGTRKAQAISKVCFAGAALMEAGTIRDIRIALGSIAPIVMRAVKTEDLLRGGSLTPVIAAAKGNSCAREISPIDDIRSTARYRLRVAQNLLEEFLSQLADENHPRDPQQACRDAGRRKGGDRAHSQRKDHGDPRL